MKSGERYIFSADVGLERVFIEGTAPFQVLYAHSDPEEWMCYMVADANGVNALRSMSDGIRMAFDDPNNAAIICKALAEQP